MIKGIYTYNSLLMVLFLFCASHNSFGQKFSGGLIVGFNASQIRGDNMGGFDKLGLNIGVTAIYPINRQTALNVELVYSQRGSQNEIIQDNSIDRQFVLNYAAVPVTIEFKDWYDAAGDYYRMRFEAGVSYGRLLSSSINGYKKGENADVDIVLDAYRTTDISWIVGSAYFFNDRTGVKVRYTRSFAPVLDVMKNPDAFTNDLLSFFLSFQLVYLL